MTKYRKKPGRESERLGAPLDVPVLALVLSEGATKPFWEIATWSETHEVCEVVLDAEGEPPKGCRYDEEQDLYFWPPCWAFPTCEHCEYTRCTGGGVRVLEWRELPEISEESDDEGPWSVSPPEGHAHYGSLEHTDGRCCSLWDGAPLVASLISDANDKAKAEARVAELESRLKDAEEDVMGDACQFARDTGAQIADLEAEAERLLEELEERKEVDGRVFAALQEVAEILDEPHPTDAPAAVRSLVAERDSLNALAAKRAVELEDANAKAGGE